MNMNEIHKNFDAQKIILCKKVICAVFIPKHPENLTGPSVSMSILSLLALEINACLSFA